MDEGFIARMRVLEGWMRALGPDEGSRGLVLGYRNLEKGSLGLDKGFEGMDKGSG